jgi:hypothetical protein
MKTTLNLVIWVDLRAQILLHAGDVEDREDVGLWW